MPCVCVCLYVCEREWVCVRACVSVWGRKMGVCVSVCMGMQW